MEFPCVYELPSEGLETEAVGELLPPPPPPDELITMFLLVEELVLPFVSTE